VESFEGFGKASFATLPAPFLDSWICSKNKESPADACVRRALLALHLMAFPSSCGKALPES
jgi:hypothetical protein